MIKKIGHRGACGYEPENTISSFQRAIELGVDMIELDVHLSKDNEVIVMHDETLQRTTTGRGKIRDLNLSEIKSYKTKDKNQKIPTLQEIIDQVKGKVEINIEIKLEDTAERVADIVKKNGIEKDVVISSNYPKALKTVKRLNPNIRTALLYYATKTGPGLPVLVFFSKIFLPCVRRLITKRLKDSGATYLNLTYLLATKDLVNYFQEKGYKVNVWTVNNNRTIEKMKNLEVDGIITNYPDRI